MYKVKCITRLHSTKYFLYYKDLNIAEYSSKEKAENVANELNIEYNEANLIQSW